MMAHSLCINWGQVESLKADLHILIISALLIHCYVNRGIRGSLVKITICPWERKYKYIQVHASRNTRQKALFKGPKSATCFFVLKMTPPLFRKFNCFGSLARCVGSFLSPAEKDSSNQNEEKRWLFIQIFVWCIYFTFCQISINDGAWY